MNPCSVSTRFATSSKRLLVAIIVFLLAGWEELCPYSGHCSRILCLRARDVKQRPCRRAMHIAKRPGIRALENFVRRCSDAMLADAILACASSTASQERYSLPQQGARSVG